MTTTASIINQLKPFSPHRFDACMNYLMRTYGQRLSQHDIAKLHLMIDFYHVLETGKQAIGGPLNPWKYGPVINDGYNRIRSLGHRYDEVKKSVRNGKIQVIGKSKNAYLYDAYDKVDSSIFSPIELEAMKRAWEHIMPMTFSQRESFFHEPSTYMGKLWLQSKNDQTGIDWRQLVDVYDEQYGQDHSKSKMLIDLWREP